MFSAEVSSTFKAIKHYLKQLYGKQNFTLMVTSYEVYDLFHKLHMK